MNIRAAAVLSLALLLGAAPAAAAPGDLVTTFGEGVFSYSPIKLDFGPAGVIYALDYGQGDVKTFESTDPLFPYALTGSWNASHPEREYPQYGMFLNPQGIAVIGDRVYVSNTGHNRVQVFNLAGFPLFDIVPPAEEVCAWYPASIAKDTAGNVYIADHDTYALWWQTPDGEPYYRECGRRILVFSGDGTWLRTIGGPGEGPGKIGFPQGVAVDAQGRVLVADVDQVEVFAGDGTWLFAFGEAGTGSGQFDLTADLATDGEGRIYVSDFFNHRIQVFDGSGALLAVWAVNLGDGTEFMPHGLTLDPAAGLLYVADFWNNRFVVLEAFPVAACGSAWQGFLPPVSLGKAFQAGSTIPVKFALADCDGKPVDGVKATLSLRPGETAVAVTAKAKRKAKKVAAAAGGEFVSLDEGKYRFNLKTAGLSAGAWTLVVTLGDGTEQTKTIRIK